MSNSVKVEYIDDILAEIDRLPESGSGESAAIINVSPRNNPVSHDDLEIDRLARLPPFDYERQRKTSAGLLGIKRVSSLDTEVKVRQQQLKIREDENELEDGIEPWPHPVNGNDLANEIRSIFERHCILPAGGSASLTLWAIASHCINAFRIFPKLCLTSPEKRCGKTTTMEVLGALVFKQLNASNITPAAIFRAVECWTPTLLIDEADTFLGSNDEMRGIINSGHRKSGAFVLRVDGEGANMAPKKFSTWSPMVIAMIKTPPDTIKDRSLMIQLRRKGSEESIAKLPFEPLKDWYELRQKCQRFYVDNREALQRADPKMPNVGNDRAIDNWIPLVAIADLLGGDWPELTRNAMVMIEGVKTDEDDSPGVMVLTDIRQAFNEKNVTRLSSQQLVDYLVDMEDRPWCEWKRGHPMTKRSLANLLKPFCIRSKKLRDGYSTFNGYEIDRFSDAFARYLNCYGTTEQTMDSTTSSVP